jgi:hypothetical protein
MAVWAGAELYPHRAHLAFRQIAGDSDFVEVPISVDTSRPTADGDRHEAGFEWPYVPSRKYDHRAVALNIVRRAEEERHAFSTYVTNTHQDQDYADPDHPSSVKLGTIFESLRRAADESGLGLVGTTVAEMCDRVRREM